MSKRAKEHFFESPALCRKSIEVKRDTWTMCGLPKDHKGPCEPVPTPTLGTYVHDNPLVRLVRGEITVEEYVADLKRRVDEQVRETNQAAKRRGLRANRERSA